MLTRYTIAVVIAVAFATPLAANAQSTPSLNLEGSGTVGFGVCPEYPICAGCPPVSCPGTFNATLSGGLDGAITSQPLQMTLMVPYFVPIPLPPQPGPSPIPSPWPTPVPLNNTSARAKSSRPLSTKKQLQALEQDVQTIQGEIAALQQQVGSGTPPLIPYEQGCVPATGSGTFAGTSYNVGFFGQLCVFANESNAETLSGTIWIVQNSSSADVVWATGTMVASGTVHLIEAGNPIAASAPMVVSIVGAVGQVPQFTP